MYILSLSESIPDVQTINVTKAKPLIRGNANNGDARNQPDADADADADADDGIRDKNDDDTSGDSLPSYLTLITLHGDIVIELKPSWALDSVKYIQKLLQSQEQCQNCRLYRAEQHGILQGVLRKPDVQPNEVLGDCPENTKLFKPNNPCHGPMMTRGMVGWAAGKGGPDFFIHNYDRAADWWGHEHTVWGQVIDESLEVVSKILDLPAHKQSGMMFLDESIQVKIE
eukprot:CAMPEP_0197245254 /NCGR_PEP_ID=MMETSP1429-20130617/10096_1 /TAXON_ID=49237 /ORGANISM="Chaetoceros  sp., Strain UNC1202" /LENGTH=226 /DNA_ID=CAMNT_0042705715 /DNA_START=195 /DNA_END=875 /DNA_ORIENTATION=+